MTENKHICPWWIGYLLVNPIRRLGQNPDRILSPYVSNGMTALDVGCGMGFFSLDMARRVGEEGKVICVDLQEKMITSLLKRAGKAGLKNRIEPRSCSGHSLNIDDLGNQVDFALAFAIVHEVPDPESFFRQIFLTLKPGGSLLFSEPKGHVSELKFKKSIDIAINIGLISSEPLDIMRSRSMLLKK